MMMNISPMPRPTPEPITVFSLRLRSLPEVIHGSKIFSAKGPASK